MPAPAHYLAEMAERRAKDYTDEKIQELEKRVKQLEDLVKKLGLV